MPNDDLTETPVVSKKRKPLRLREKEIEKGLKEIYQNPEMGSGDLSTFERAGGRRKMVLAGALIFFIFLAVASWAGFFIFKSGEKFVDANIDIVVEAPEFLTAGNEEEIVIRYKNNEEMPLGEVDIMAAFPRDFTVTSREPELPEGVSSWKIGSLPKGGEGEIKVRGRIDAPKGKEFTFQTYFSYRPADFNSIFQKVASQTVRVTESQLAATLEGSEKALDGEDVRYKITYENKSKSEIEGAEIRVEYAENFFTFRADPAPQEGKGRWILPKLKPGQKGEINFFGSFSSGAEGNKETSVEIGVNDKNKGWLPQDKTFSSIAVVKSELKLLLVMNGQSKDSVANFGETLRYSLTYQNKSDSSLSGVVLTMHLNGLPVLSGRSVLLWDTLLEDFVGKKNVPVLIWTKREIPALGKLAAGEEETIDFSIDLASAPFANKGLDYRVESFAEAAIERVGGIKAERTIRSETIVIRLLSDLRFKAEARYFNDDDMAVGTGPVPPRISETTTYKIWWSVKNSLHEIGPSTVGATLPDGVSFTGKFTVSPSSTLAYDEKTRKVTWSIEKVPANAEDMLADFEVSITPAEDHLGATPVLTDIANFEGRDLFLDALIFRTSAPLTTDLENDPNLSGRGTVRR